MNQFVRLTMDAFRLGFGASISESAFADCNNFVIDINCLAEVRQGGSLKNNLLSLLSEMRCDPAFACMTHASYIKDTGGFYFSQKSEYQNVRGGGIP